ncbi:MAG: tetratricopeptide repeat protein [Armatimonadota bacterium]
MSPNPASARDQGIRFLKQGSNKEAIEFLQEAIDEDPKDVELYLYLGYAYGKSEDFQSTIDILEKAVDLAPTSAKIHYNLGVAYQKMHNITEAKDEYMRALGLDPGYQAAKMALDSILSQQSAGGPLDESATQ